MASDRKTTDAEADGSTFRSIASVLIFVHLFCVAVVLSSNWQRSALQGRLVSLFAAYTQLLHFDPDFTPYYYTFGRPIDDDATFELDLYADAERPVASQSIMKSVRLPEGGTNWLGDRRRYFTLARLVAYNAAPEVDREDVTAEIARSVGARVLRENGAHRAVVRCVHRESQPLDLGTLRPGFPPDDPTAEAYNVVVYEADVWIDEDNQVQVLKRASRAEVAPRQTAPASTPDS
jgi:hypothetical protein